MPPSKLIEVINPRVGDPRRDLFFCLPSFVQQQTEGAEIAFFQCCAHSISERADFMERLHGHTLVSTRRLFLLLENSPRMVSRTRKKQHQVALQVLHDPRLYLKRFHAGRAVTSEGYKIQSTKGASIFILLTNIASQCISCDVKSTVS